ncbi:MAG: PadR family transcriptional regulator [Anaerosolibacter sp.]|uniref:PadR family transcriptional regulator n=1 Tax=Anaerosolibacter sp. TaxID=1872527 RepID=UPI00262985FE|nr:PadR family transcriptional regulator [Anaerosolibacter sp.]MDF2545379.1 PadR family transcriptional regulator [Anaerosolibacter sp.]
MQSKTAFILLGLIKETPMNPYEIIKVLNFLNISKWTSISPSSVYMTIKTLEKKGLIDGRKEKEGAMPEKTVYSITIKGETSFLEMLASSLKSDLMDAVKFNLASLFICHLDRSKVLELLDTRLSSIQKEKVITAEALSEYRSIPDIPEYSFISLHRNIRLLETEYAVTQDFIQFIKASDRWNYFLTMNE